jgi:hypothetical protein
MKHASLFLTLTLAITSFGCAAKTLDGGSDNNPPGSSSSSGSGSSSGGSSNPSGIPDKPVEGTIGGKPFAPKSVEIQYSKSAEQWFISLRNYEVTCGTLKNPKPAEADMLVVTVGKLDQKAGTFDIAYADGHGATFQIGVYDTTSKADTREVKTGTLRLDAWNDAPGATVTGALKLSGEQSDVSGTFTATVCAPR